MSSDQSRFQSQEVDPRAPGSPDRSSGTPGLNRAASPRLAATPAERTLRARSAAYRLHSLYDSRELTAKARAAFNDRFYREVDPDNRLSDAERARRAECARKAYYVRLAAKSARARRAHTKGS